MEEYIVPECKSLLDSYNGMDEQRRFMDSHKLGYMRYNEIAQQCAEMCEGKGLKIVDLSKTDAKEHKRMLDKLVSTAATHLRSWEVGSRSRVMEELLTAYSYGFSIRRNTKIPVKMQKKERVEFYAFLAPLLFDAFYYLVGSEDGTRLGTSIYLTSKGLIPYVITIY